MKASPIVALISLAAFVCALPAESGDLSARENGKGHNKDRGSYEIEWCQGSRHGDCNKYQGREYGNCYNLGGDYYPGRHGNGYYCRYYKKSSCDGKYYSDDDEKYRSYKCYSRD